MYFMTLFGVRQILNDEFQYALYMKDRLKREKVLSDNGSPEDKEAYRLKIGSILSKTGGAEEKPGGNREGHEQAEGEDVRPP